VAKEIKHRKSVAPTIMKVLVAIVLVVALAAAVYFFVRYRQISDKYHEATMSQQEREQKTVDEVSKIMALPQGESPVILVVQDKNKLGASALTQQYFANTQNNDVILAYEKANISVVYRPSEKRIIKTDNYTNFVRAANPIKIAILAATDQQTTIETTILEKVLNAEIIAKNVPKTSLSGSYVVDVTGQNQQAAQDLANELKLMVGSLPAGEDRPEGAQLIVVIAPSSTVMP
jgi:hypothetical protein